MTIKKNSDNSVKGVHDLALNPSLGRDRHKQQVAPDRHPATDCKPNSRSKPFKMATWNVRTLNQKGKLENVIKEMERMKLNILGLSEVRWVGKGKIKTGNKTMIYSGGETHERGVGILLDETVAKSIKGFWGISDRVIIAKLEGKPFDIGIVQIYAPTSEHDEEEVEQFYEDLDKAMKQLKSQDIKIVMGDFNAKVGDAKIEDIVGPWGLGTENERGERLVEWCRENDLMISNTWYQNHRRRRYTWKSPGDRIRNQIDYILIQKRFRNAVKSSKSMPGADCDSDHVPVMCKMHIKLKKQKKSKYQPKFHIDLLKTDEELKGRFTLEVSNRFQALENITEAEELWRKMKDSINQVMSESIPPKPKRTHKKWITQDILDLMEVRRQAKPNAEKYKALNKEVRKKCDKAKETWVNEQCEEIDKNQSKDSKYMHSKIKEVTGKNGHTNAGCIKSKEGDILMDKMDVLNRWSEYIEDLFQDNREEKPVIKKDLDGPPILKEEVKAAIKKMKPGKTAGPDNIPIEVIATLEEVGIEVTTKLLNSIYDSGKIPEDLIKSVFIALPKTPGATECELHRTISLMSHITKVLLRVLLGRMRKSLRPEISKAQFGFVPDKGTRNAIFTLSMLMERCIEMQKDLYMCFIDYSKAFDKVKHVELFKLLEELDIDGKELRIVRNLYWDQTAAVRIDGDYSAYKNIKRGVRQGCVMSPDLFNLYSEIILRNIEDSPGLKVNGETINNIRYADDTVLLADSLENLQSLLNIVVTESERKGLSLNVKKTECMVVSKNAVNPICNLESKGEKINQVQKFKYLGYIITSDGKCVTEIKRRIGMAKDSFNKMKPILKNRNITLLTKLKVIKSYVWSILLYGCECWTITKDTEKRLEAVEMWFIRRLLGISWKEKKTNETVMREANIERSLIKSIRKRQMQFIGHLNRHKGLEHLTLTGKLEGKRGRGRPRITYLESLNRWATGKNQGNITFLRKSELRNKWHAMIADVCSRSGT